MIFLSNLYVILPLFWPAHKNRRCEIRIIKIRQNFISLYVDVSCFEVSIVISAFEEFINWSFLTSLCKVGEAVITIDPEIFFFNG